MYTVHTNVHTNFLSLCVSLFVSGQTQPRCRCTEVHTCGRVGDKGLSCLPFTELPLIGNRKNYLTRHSSVRRTRGQVCGPGPFFRSLFPARVLCSLFLWTALQTCDGFLFELEEVTLLHQLNVPHVLILSSSDPPNANANQDRIKLDNPGSGP